jgi:hypothetical protein
MCKSKKKKKTQINLYNLSMTRMTLYQYSIIHVWFNTILLYSLFKNGAQVLKETCSFLRLNFWVPKQWAIEKHRYQLHRSNEMHELQNTLYIVSRLLGAMRHTSYQVHSTYYCDFRGLKKFVLLNVDENHPFRD